MLRLNVKSGSQSDSSGLRQLIGAVAGEALKDLLRNLRHHSELQRRIASGELDAQQVNTAYLQYAKQVSGEYRREVAEATVSYYRTLAQLSARYSEQFYEQVLADAARERGEEQESPARAIPVELHGPPGREVVGRFTVENTAESQMQTRFRIGTSSGADGVRFTPPLTIHPAELTLPPGEKAAVTLRLALLRGLFEPGHVYRCEVTAEGRPDLRLDVIMWAEPEEGPGPSAEPDTTEPTVTLSDEPSAEPARNAWQTRCPTCGRTFERSEPTTRLYPHKSPEGESCPEREGTAELA